MKILISSTIYDLQDLRDILESELESDGHEVILSEHGSVLVEPGEHTYKSCLKEAADSDCTIAIIDRRFGGEYSKDKSITEAEIENARKHNKRTLVFVRQTAWTCHSTQKELFIKQGQPYKAAKGIVDDYRVFELIDRLAKKNIDNWLFQFNDFTDLLRQIRRQLNRSLPLSLNFLGREEAIEDIKKITDQSKQIIVVYADSGVGKTTLAENFFELDKSYKQLLKVDDISTDGNTTAEEVLNKLLKQLGINALTRSSEFEGNLNLLEQKLIERGLKTGLFIDNIEPLLDGDGKFIDSKYEDLFLKISCLRIKHLVLFTSCISLKFENNNLNDRIENYHLDNLPFKSWQYFFRENEIPFEDEVLEDIYKKCSGNAKVMSFLRGIIKKDYNNNLNDFWTNKREITNSKELIEKYLNDFRNIDPNAYELLCYLECYNIAKIPDRHVRRLADDISGLQNSKLAISLKDRCILEVKTDTYYLHKLFRREVCDRLQSNPADLTYWREINPA
jgi:hypothetical protein